MSNLRLHLSDPQIARRASPPRPLGRHLIDAGVITAPDLIHALNLQRHVDAPLGEVLIAEGLARRSDVMQALSLQHHAQLVDLEKDPPTLSLASRLPVAVCLAFRAVPWVDMAGTLIVATSRPHLFEKLRIALGPQAQTILPAIADEHDIQTQITRLYGTHLAQRAATRVPANLSCRTWNVAGKTRSIVAAALRSYFSSRFSRFGHSRPLSYSVS